MPRFTEKPFAEDHLAEKFHENDWRFVPANELQWESYTEPLLLNSLVRATRKRPSGAN